MLIISYHSLNVLKDSYNILLISLGVFFIVSEKSPKSAKLIKKTFQTMRSWLSNFFYFLDFNMKTCSTLRKCKIWLCAFLIFFYFQVGSFRFVQKACGNGINSNIFRCNTNRCKFQLDFYPSDKVVSSITNRIYDCVTLAGTMYLNCHSVNVNYLINCCWCLLRYIGETMQILTERFKSHKTGFKHPLKHENIEKCYVTILLMEYGKGLNTRTKWED